jgi:hypothetical protein
MATGLRHENVVSLAPQASAGRCRPVGAARLSARDHWSGDFRLAIACKCSAVSLPDRVAPRRASLGPLGRLWEAHQTSGFAQ